MTRLETILEEQKQTEELTCTESQPHSDSARGALISQWLFRFAANHRAQGKCIEEPEIIALRGLWLEQLEDIPIPALSVAFAATIRTIKFFPTVADIRSHVESAEQLNIEDDWQEVLDYLREWEWGDGPGGLLRGAPPLAPEIDHAIRAAGGIGSLTNCSREDLQWAKKRFVEDLTRMRQTDDLAGLLHPAEFYQVLRDSRNLSQEKLPAASRATTGQERTETVKEFHPTPRTYTPNPPVTEEEFRAKKKRQVDELIARGFLKRTEGQLTGTRP